MSATDSWNPHQVLEQLATSRQELLALVDLLMAGLESGNPQASLPPTFARLYRRMVAIIEEEKSLLARMNHPEQNARAAIQNQLARRVSTAYQAFKKAQEVQELVTVATDVIDAINGFAIQNSLLWDQISRDLKKADLDQGHGELAQAEVLLAKIGIPSPPRILLEISKEMKKTDPNLARISGLVREDPGLSARVIQVVNSPLYGLKVRVKSIDHAVSMLGLRLFQRAVLAGSLRDALSSGNKDNQQFELFWRHSVVVARAAEFIAVWLKDYQVSAELAYMAGLFHDCAIPPLMAKFPKYGALFTDGAVASGQNIRDLENNGFETNHCVVGCLISKSWGLDPSLQDVIRYHHHETLPPSVADSEEVSKLWTVLKVTELITAHLVMKAGGPVVELSRQMAENPVKYVGEATLREIGIGQEEFGYLLEDVKELAALGEIT